MNLTITYFKLWSTHALKNYIAIRKKLVEGGYQDLAAKAFACYENDVPILTSMCNRIIPNDNKNSIKTKN